MSNIWCPFWFLIMCFDSFAHSPIVTLDGYSLMGLCLVMGLSTLPSWHVQRDVETSNNLNKKCFIKFPKGEKIEHFKIIHLVNILKNVGTKSKLLKLHMICTLFLFFSKGNKVKNWNFTQTYANPSMGLLVFHDLLSIKVKEGVMRKWK
jgi:hypothetical protein